MVHKKVVPPPPPPEPPREFRSPQEIDIAIAKLNRLIQELERLDVASAVISGTGADTAAQTNIRAAILEVFGSNSPEYQEHQHIRIWAGGVYQNMPMREVMEAMKGGRKRVIGILENLIGRLEDKRSNLSGGTIAGHREVEKTEVSPGTCLAPTTNLDRLNLHPRIRDVAQDLCLDGHYWEAVSDGARALVTYVKERSGRHDLDGTHLIRTVFAPNNPILEFNSLATETELNEQEGMMHLFEGVVLAIRDPSGHSLPSGSDQRALEYLALLSLLAYRLQDATRRTSQ